MANPKRYYTPELQKQTRAKLSRIQCPILILDGGVHPVNRFNREVLIPELGALGKHLDPHCFCVYGERPRTPHPEVALKAFIEMQSFCRCLLPTKPNALDPTLLKQVPVSTA